MNNLGFYELFDFQVLGETRSAAPAENLAASLEEICLEADSIKSSLRNTLPVSWSSGTADTVTEDMDFSAAIGSELVELLVLAAELVRDYVIPKVSKSALSG